MASDGRDLATMAAGIGAELKARKETIAVAESSAGGLINAALVAVPGASAYYLGGEIIYTAAARERVLGITRDEMAGLRSASEPYARLVARRVREQLGATWGLCETGASGPTGMPNVSAALSIVSRSTPWPSISVAAEWRRA